VDASEADKIVSMVHQKHQESCLYKLLLTGEWMLNQAFLQNQQWVVWDRSKQELRDAKNPRGEIRHTENLITPYTMSVVQLLNSGKPLMSLVPTRNIAMENAWAAEVSQACLDYVDNVIAFEKKTKEMNLWRATLGTSFIRMWIDPEAGEKLSLPVRNPETGADDKVEVQEGELRAEVFSPWDVHIFPTNAPTPDDVVAVQFVTAMPVEEAKEKWPDFAEQISASDDLTPYEYNKRRVEWLNSPMNGMSGYGANQGLARVIEHIEAPTKANPRGRKLVVVNRLLVQNEPNEFADMFEKEVPNYLKMGWVCFRFIEVPGRVWGRGAIEDMRSPQIRLNELVTDVRKHRRAHLKTRIFVPDGSGVDKITNATDGVYHYTPRPGVPPITVVPAQQLGDAPYKEIAEIKAGMSETSMRPEVARGLNAPQVRSAEQAQLLLDQANQPFGLIARDTELGYADLTRLKMGCVNRWYSDLKITRIVGETKGYAVGIVRNENLYTDVAVVAGSALPKNMAAWNQMLSQMVPLLTAGGGPEAIRMVNAIIEQIDLGGVKFEKPNQADVDRQDTELAMMSAGRWVEPEIYDDHISHSDRCDVWLKKHPTANPVVKKMVEMHQMQHHVMMARAAMPPMQAMLGVPQMASQGTKTTGDRLHAAVNDGARRQQADSRLEQQRSRAPQQAGE
jgi:hypothetical protein